MTFPEARDWLFQQLPMFQRNGPSAYKKDLHNTISLCNLLNNPQHSLTSIHVAGTNGKGSVSHMLAAILQEQGYKTGLYTSPHLKCFTERIRINGNAIPKKTVATFVDYYKEMAPNIQPSFFEWTVALAFHYFNTENVDIAVIETGLGGRLDSTNVINPICSVITNIGWDHMDLLGNSLTSIAKEKAGIIKPNKPVVIGEIIPETKDVFYETAKKNNAELHLAATVPLEMNKTWNATNGTRTFQSPNLPQPFQLPLPGSYQFNNVQTVIKTCEVISKHGFHISPLAIQQGLEKTIQHTQLQGRWQTLSQHPLTIADTAHNVHGFEKAMAQLSEHPAPQKHLVLGFVNDKDVMAMLAFVPKSWIIYATSPKIPRAMPIHTLASHLKKHNYNFKSYRSVKRALHYAQKNAKPHEIVYVGGSTFVVAEVV